VPGCVPIIGAQYEGALTVEGQGFVSNFVLLRTICLIMDVVAAMSSVVLVVFIVVCVPLVLQAAKINANKHNRHVPSIDRKSFCI
jgi:uncharacterized membrane protein